MKTQEKKDTFGISGPFHLTTVDWKNADHRMTVAASLVQGVYVQERDRKKKRQKPNDLGRPWWKSFKFHLHRPLEDVHGSIFGAIYELLNPAEGAPTLVIAFRGTNKLSFQDLRLNLKCFTNRLRQTSRYEIALKNVKCMVAGRSNVWLAGHSLGAVIGMCVGKHMAKMNIYLETLLFNPPLISTPFGIIKNKKLECMFRILGSIITAAVTIAVKGRPQTSRSEDPWVALSAWVPCIFVNPGDPICSEFIGHYESWTKMKAMGLEYIMKLAAENWLPGLFFTAIGREPVDSEPLHSLPSVNQIINRSPMLNLCEAHGISQWWNPHFDFHTIEYVNTDVDSS